MARQSANHGIAASLDGLDGVLGGAVLQDDAQLGKLGVQALERGQELALSVQDRDALLLVAGNLAVQVKDQATLLHGSKNRVEGLVGQHAGRGVGGDAGGVALDARDAGALGLADDLGSDGLVQVQGHGVVDRGVDGLEACLVLEGLCDGSDGRDQVGHHVGRVDAAAADGWHDGRGHGSVAEVDVKVRRRGQLKRAERHDE